ncbi:MAG: hypothetical protein ACP5JW_01475 [Candidatus Bathyarchaeia archaeon]
MAMERPFGVTVLAILEIVSELFSLGAGALMLAAAGFIGTIVGEMPEAPGVLGGLVAGMLIVIGVVMVILGLISFSSLMVYGLVKDGLGPYA